MSPFLAELLGTMLLIILGDGVVANVVLSGTKGQNSGWIVITTGWAFAVSVAVYAVGAVGVATMVWLAYLPHWRVTESQANKLGVFCTGPAIRSTIPNLITEIIGTAVLVLGVLAILTPKNLNPAYSWDVGFGPALVGIIVWAIGLSLGGPTGYAINPARDLGPRLAHALLPIPGKGPSDWRYAWIPVLGPIIGGIIAAFLYKAWWPA